MSCCPHQETLANNRNLIGAGVTRLVSEFHQWTRFERIIATINVSAAALAAGDTLIAQLQTRPGSGYEWINLGSPFTTILGTAAEPEQQTIAIPSGGTTWWHGELATLVTLAGATSNFTFGIRIEGND